MLLKNYTYKWYPFFSGSLSMETRVTLQQVDKNVSTRSVSFDLANQHGVNSGPSLAGARLFDFAGIITEDCGKNRDNIFQSLTRVANLEADPFDNPFHELTWQTKYGDNRYVQAKVSRPISPRNGNCDPLVNFTFQLQADDPRVYGEEVCVEGSYGLYGGNKMPNTMPNQLNEYCNATKVYNEGDRLAPMYIQCLWTLINPKILIFDEYQKLKYFIRIDGTTTNLEVDNRDITNAQFDVTDNGLDISGLIREESGGGPLYLNPWVSFVLVTCDNYADAQENATVNIKYRSAFSF